MNRPTILTAALVCVMAAGCAYGQDRIPAIWCTTNTPKTNYPVGVVYDGPVIVASPYTTPTIDELIALWKKVEKLHEVRKSLTITTATVTNEVDVWQYSWPHIGCLVNGCEQMVEWREEPYNGNYYPSYKLGEKRKKPDYRREVVRTITTASLEYNGRTITVEVDNVVVRTNNYNRVKVSDAVYEWRGE